MTKEEFLKQKILFPKDTILKYCDDPELGWGGNYSELTILLFGNSLTRLETERINVGIQEFEKLLDELPLLILQAYAFRKRCLAPIKRAQKGMAIPGRLSYIHRFKVRLTAEQRQILYRKPTDKEEVDILNNLLNDFKNTHDYCYTLNDANGLKRVYKGRRTVLHLAYLIASYRALRKIINDTSFNYKEPYDPFGVMYKPTYPLQVNLNKQIAFVNKMFKLSIKNPRTRESTRVVYMEDLESLKKMRMLHNGNPPDLIHKLFFRKISSYLWMEERFNAMETGFLLAKTKVIDVCARCDHNTPRHCPLVFKDSIVKVPCKRKYDILRRVR